MGCIARSPESIPIFSAVARSASATLPLVHSLINASIVGLFFLMKDVFLILKQVYWRLYFLVCKGIKSHYSGSLFKRICLANIAAY